MPLNVTLDFPRSSAAPLPGLVVHSYHLHEAISELFEVTLEVMSTDPAVDMQAVVGEQVVVGFGDEAFLPAVTGIVRAVRQLSSVLSAPSSLGASSYEVAIVPPLWLATRRQNHRIFQDMTVPEIVGAVLADYGSRIAPPRPQLGRQHAKREYCVQYAETDYDFLTRLLAEEHIATFFDHANQGTLVLVDDTTSLTPRPVASVVFRPASGQVATAPHVTNVVLASCMETSSVHLRDYDFENPRLSRALPVGLEGARDATPASSLFVGEAELEAYSFAVGRFGSKPDGDELAARMLESMRGLSRTLTCETSFGLGAGQSMTIVGHSRNEVNADLLVVRQRIMVEDGASAVSGAPTEVRLLECTRRDLPFHPLARPKPRIWGNQTAFVVGDTPEGSVDVDAFGRVKVEFVWDRRDLRAGNPTRFVRVSQGWAGGGFGFVTLPRIGDEVIVAYLDGDPNEPVIVGRVHNAVTRTPLDLPVKHATHAVWRSRSFGGGNGFNQILMDDAVDAERLELHAERDFTSETGKTSKTTVGGDASLDVGGHATNKVVGSYDLRAGGVNVATGGYRLSAKTIDETASASMNLTAATVTVEGRDGIKLVSGGSEIVISPGGITISAGKITISGGSITVKADDTVDVDGALITLN